jgi:hypothetical protein
MAAVRYNGVRCMIAKPFLDSRSVSNEERIAGSIPGTGHRVPAVTAWRGGSWGVAAEVSAPVTFHGG